MVFDYHLDIQQHFDQQRQNAREQIMPFIAEVFPLREGLRVLEIGCAEGGVLKAFLDAGCRGTGVELDAVRYERARSFLKDDLAQGRARLIRKDIYDINVEADFGRPFDLVILKDVIEHIPDQARLLRRLRDFLQPDGAVFFGFPPWLMPFGGHQQICDSRVLAVLPYFHLLPTFLYRALLRLFGEKPARISQLLEVKGTGISLERFEGLLRRTNYTLARRTLFLVNPIYKYKFGLKVREQFRLVAALPYVRDFLTTCGYYLVRPTAG